MLSRYLQFALLLLLSASACAQITSPDKLIAPEPRNPAHTAAAADDDLQWMWSYATTGSKHELFTDRRFQTLLNTTLRAPQAFWSAPGTPLADAARAFLAGPGLVAPQSNRRILIDGCIVDKAPETGDIPCGQRGLFAVDFGAERTLILFAALRWNESGRALGQPGTPYTLWLFPSRTLEDQHIPAALREALSHWLSARPCAPGTLSSVILVDPDGVPHILGTLDVVNTTNLCSPAPKAIPS